MKKLMDEFLLFVLPLVYWWEYIWLDVACVITHLL